MLKRLLTSTRHSLQPPRVVPGEAASSHCAVAAAQFASPVIGVLGAKGGVGATTLAANLAAAVSQREGAATLIDANLQHPDAAVVLGCEPKNSLLDLLGRENQLDRQLLDACCIGPIAGVPGLRLLSAPLHGRAAIGASLSDLSRLVLQTRSFSKFSIIDCPRHIDKHLVTLTDACDLLVVAFEGNLSCVSMVRRWLSIFAELGYSDDRIVCVLNRCGGKYSAAERELVRCLGDREIVRVPNASAAMWECASTGVPVVVAQPRHAYSLAVQQLAERLRARLQARNQSDE